MAFKSKIKPGDIENLDFKTYIKMLGKEVKRASKFGQTSVVAFSDFKFACGYEGSLLLLGKFSGELAKCYKKAKTSRKKEKDFARGTCYFETDETGKVVMHIALKEGKAKPAKLKKNGRALFKKIGFVPNIFKGDLPGVEEDVQLSKEEVEQVNAEADTSNDLKNLSRLQREYTKSFKMLSEQVIPLLKNKGTYLPEHFEIAKNTYRASAAFISKFEQANDKKHEKFESVYESVKKNHTKLQKVAAKVKQELGKNAQVHGSADKVESVLQDVETTIKDMRVKFKTAFDLLDEIIKNK